METLPLFSHPITIIMVDEDLGFLRRLALRLPPHWAIRMTDSAEAAMAYLLNGRSPLPDRLRDAHQRVFDPERFAEPAILVADLNLSGMNGLELCKALANTPILTILLTDRADEKMAVDAFNHGLISRFVDKHDPDVPERLHHYFVELQRRYFEHRYPLQSASHVYEAPAFASDLIFAHAFADILARERIVESYFVANPQGYLLLDEVGSARLLVVFGADDLRAQLEVAQDEGAPDEFLRILREMNHVPIFRDGDNHYRQGDDYWRDALYPAHKIEGRETWYWALLPDAAPYAIADDTVFSYANYLDRLDRQGPELGAKEAS